MAIRFFIRLLAHNSLIQVTWKFILFLCIEYTYIQSQNAEELIELDFHPQKEKRNENTHIHTTKEPETPAVAMAMQRTAATEAWTYTHTCVSYTNTFWCNFDLIDSIEFWVFFFFIRRFNRTLTDSDQNNWLYAFIWFVFEILLQFILFLLHYATTIRFVGFFSSCLYFRIDLSFNEMKDQTSIPTADTFSVLFGHLKICLMPCIKCSKINDHIV